MNPQQNQSTVALVTGGSGFIGSHLVDLLVELGQTVHIVDDSLNGAGKNQNPDSHFHQLDICDASIGELIADLRPHVIYHLAAQVSVAVSAKEPELDARINVMGTLNLLEAARNTDPSPKVVYISTGGAIHGHVPECELPATEATPTVPMSPYGASKLAIENYLPVYKHLYGLRHLIVRPANIYGPRQDPHGEAGVIAIFAKAMLENREITIFGTGDDERDYVYISDFVKGVAAIGKLDHVGIYNIASGIGVSVNEIFHKLKNITGYKLKPLYGEPRAGDIPKIRLDATKALQDLNWRPTISFDDGLKKTVDWFQSNS